MRYARVCIEDAAYLLPPNVVTSEDIEHRLKPLYDRLRLPRGRLELMSGIRERRFWDPGTRASDAGSKAGEALLSRSKIDRDRIGCIVHASVCRDFLEPATAAVVHEKLGLAPDCMIFDLSNACLGGLNGAVAVANMIELGQIEAGLVVTGEVAEGLYEATIHDALQQQKLSRADFKRYFASLTIGSGAAAILLAREDIATTRHRLLGGAVMADSSGNALCRASMHADTANIGPLMVTDSEALLQAGAQLAAQTWEAAKAELGWTNDTPQHFFTHQVGVAHRNLVFATMGLGFERDFPTVQFTGNTGSSALPIAFAMGIEKKRIAAGERIGLLGIGSGLCSLMLGAEW